MTPLNITIAVVIFVVMDLIIIGAVFSVAAGSARTIAEKFPAKAVRPDAVRREFQSVAIGMGNWGGSYHLAVDEQHLHMEPAWLMRKLRVRTASVPWDQVKRARGTLPRRGRGIATIGGETVRLPVWALELAQEPR